MFELPSQFSNDPLMMQLAQIKAKQAAQMQANNNPINLLAPPQAGQAGAQQRQGGGSPFRIENPNDHKTLVDEILKSEMSKRRDSPWQMLFRPLMGLAKTYHDDKTRDYETSQKSERASTLARALSGVQSGMDEQGNVAQLGQLLAGVDDPALVEAIVGYADKAGGRKFDRFHTQRNFEAGRSDEMVQRANQDRVFGAGREDAGRAAEQWKATFGAGREDKAQAQSNWEKGFSQDVDQAEAQKAQWQASFDSTEEEKRWRRMIETMKFDSVEQQRAFTNQMSTAENRRAYEKHTKDMAGGYGAPIAALDADGKPLYVQLDDAGEPRAMPGGYSPPRSNMEANRLPTPKEFADNREIEAARQQVLQIIKEKGREELGFGSSYDDLVKSARKSLVGGDPNYKPFIDALTGAKEKEAAETAPKTVTGKGQGNALVDALSGLFGGGQQARPQVVPVPDAEAGIVNGKVPPDLKKLRGNLADQEVIDQAKAAIAKGADRAAVIERLKQLGIDPTAAGL